MKLKLEYYYYCQNPQCVKYMRVWKEKKVCRFCGYDTVKCEDIMPIPAKTENGFSHRLRQHLNGARM